MVRLHLILDWLTYGLIAAVGGGWVFILSHASRYMRGDPPLPLLLGFFVGPAVILLFLGVVAFLGRRYRVAAQLAIVGTVFVFYLAEASYTIRFSPGNPTVAETIASLREAGSETVRILGRSELTQIKLGSSGVSPVGQLPNAEILHCNVRDDPMVFHSDRYGFRNPDSVWDSLSLGAVVLGDSFTAGSCIAEGKTYVDEIRRNLGPTLSVAVPGNGPLGNLSGYREYIEPIVEMRFDVLIWFHYQNDLTDLDWEKSSHLVRYANAEFGQGLRERMADARDQMATFLARPDGGAGGLVRQGRNYAIWNQVLDFVKGSQVRQRFQLLGRGGEWTPPDLVLFEKILRLVKSDVERRNARMIFVYIPSYDDIRWPGHNKEYARWNSIETAQKIGLDVLDMTESFRNRKDPYDIFPNRRAVHYNELGHSLIATQVIGFLDTIKR
ncbi:MAG: hypothetical protein HQ495_02465 [Alphaproteobacteria bacterium]|nr:hypothetical protein [Alphaproteobacteria bacterium]